MFTGLYIAIPFPEGYDRALYSKFGREGGYDVRFNNFNNPRPSLVKHAGEDLFTDLNDLIHPSSLQIFNTDMIIFASLTV